MSVQTPPKLQKLAIQTLMRNEAEVISSLEELPPLLFQILFKEAFIVRQTNLIKAMVATWPETYLPVGSLMKRPDMEILQAVQDGVDMRLNREFYTRRGKLQVLDMRNVHHAYWNVGNDNDYSARTSDKEQAEKFLPRYALRQHLKVIFPLSLASRQSESNAFFLNWAQQRKRLLYFCCIKMKIWPIAFQDIRDILKIFHLEYIRELELNIDWTLLELKYFAPYFGKMKNLRKFMLSPIHKETYPITNVTRVTDVQCLDKFISQFSKFNCLQHICLKRVHIIKDKMNQVLGCLRTPLETLSIIHCQISQAFVDSFSCSRSLFQLKHLEIKGVTLDAFDLTHLRGLLEKVVDSLGTLDLSQCHMKDSHVNVLLPALTQCSQLTDVNFCYNDFSMPTLKDLLEHTVNWRKINVEEYPAPLECYDELNHASRERFAQLCEELMDTLRQVRQPKNISFATVANTCPKCRGKYVYGHGAKLCSC
ncbi:PRAME family member 8-like [Apodemus sylvaticus]|uniref:PRAME family member 8-like n=1 Tax=Apodemus sylvaticus TaxID=10129 RepID=UPI00224265EC|nr:PRAME family member 8-like [Apodemus sylvaticus]XP_052053946.1 PRAME family member 8-like [Apodemus sylvaticus]